MNNVKDRIIPNKELSIYNKMFDEILLSECYRGSVAHNLYIPSEEENSTDDIDLIRVYCFPIQYYLTLESYKNKKDVYEKWEGEYDIVAYELRKMFDLLSVGNPNVTSMLWIKEEHILQNSEAWRNIIKNRELFISKDNIKHAFCGYANDQIKRMTSFVKEGYMGEKRMNLVNKFGYDTKNAAHCIRLLKMGVEFLDTGILNVFRDKDREELLSIKIGEWSIEQVKNYSDKLFKELMSSYDKSKLPNKNNPIKINKLLFETMKISLNL